MSALACPNRRVRRERQQPLFFLLSITNLIIIQTLWSQNVLPTCGEPNRQSELDAKNATSPLIYSKLRFDDDFLQIYQRFQKDLTMDETKVTFEVNQTLAQNKTKLVKFTYYVNNKIDATSFTQDNIIFEALDQTYFTRMFATNLFIYDNKSDMSESSDPKLVSSWKCDREMNFLLSQLDSIQSGRLNSSESGVQLNNTLSMEVLALFDAYGTEEPGLILGNNVWSGYWRQCKRSLILNLDTVNPEDTLEFKSRYCIASIRSKQWNKIAARRIRELERERYFKNPKQKYDYARFHRIQIGLCLPESCDSSLINQRRDDVHRLATHKLSEPLRSFELTDLYCLPDETSKLRQVSPLGRVFLFLVTTWLAIMISASTYDNRVGLNRRLKLRAAKPTNLLERMADSMSLFRNYERFIRTSSSEEEQLKQKVQANTVELITEYNKPAVNDLVFINCIKALSTVCVILNHSALVFVHVNRFVLDFHSVNMIIIHFIYSNIIVIDWYFVFTSFITTYVQFATKRVARNNLVDWVHFIVHRYLRLAPIYLLIFWFAKSIIKHTSSGPTWDYGTNNMTLRAICQRESFIYPLTLTSNFHPIHDECVMPSWYISCDFQFHLITPFVLVLLHRSPLMGWLITFGAILACMGLRFHRYLTDSKARHLDLMKPRYDLYMRHNWDLHATYIYPHYRIASYLAGILAGHFAYMVLSGQWQSSIYYDRGAPAQSSGTTSSSKEDARMRKRKDFLRFSLWTFSVTVMSILFFSTGLFFYLPHALEPYIKYIASFMYSIGHAGVSLALCLFLIPMMFGQFSSLKRAMSWPFWTVLSRVGYIVYLAQIEVYFWFAQTTDRLIEMNTLELFKSFLYICVAVYPIATILTITFELPIAQLERNFVAPLFRSSEGAHVPAGSCLATETNSAQRSRRDRLRATNDKSILS